MERRKFPQIGEHVDVVHRRRDPDRRDSHARQIRDLLLNPCQVSAPVHLPVGFCGIVHSRALRWIVIAGVAVKEAVGHDLVDHLPLEILRGAVDRCAAGGHYEHGAAGERAAASGKRHVIVSPRHRVGDGEGSRLAASRADGQWKCGRGRDSGRKPLQAHADRSLKTVCRVHVDLDRSTARTLRHQHRSRGGGERKAGRRRRCSPATTSTPRQGQCEADYRHREYAAHRPVIRHLIP